MIEEDQGWLPNAQVVMEHDNNRDDHRAMTIALNKQHNPNP